MSRTRKTVEEFRRDLLKLPFAVRKSRVRSILRREAIVYRNIMREAVDTGSGYYKSRTGEKVAKKGIYLRDIRRGNVKIGGYTAFIPLRESMGRFSNRRNKDLIYEVIGPVGKRKGGAFYAHWQNEGRPRYRVKYGGKRFIQNAANQRGSASVVKQVDEEITKVVNKYFVAR